MRAATATEGRRGAVSTTDSSSEPGRSRPAEHGPGTGIYLAFVPWILFSLITQHDTLKAAAVVALIAAVLIAAPAALAGRPRMLEIGAVVAFVGFTIVAFIADPSTTHWVARYARAIAALLLALIAFSSLLFVPFTEQYARESVPRQFWSTPRFKHVNRQLTVMWGCVFLAMMVSHIAAGAIDTRRGNTIFNWVIPIILIIWAVKRTGELSEAA
jgi:MFS family permease